MVDKETLNGLVGERVGDCAKEEAREKRGGGRDGGIRGPNGL